MKRISQVFAETPSLTFFLMGFILITLGGLVYALLPFFFLPIALLTIIIGITILLQSSRAFQATKSRRLIIVITISAILVILIDFWPLQYTIAQMVSTTLSSLNVQHWLSFTPRLGGAQILLIVQELGTSRLVGGEIDNACAGLIALIPCLLLLLFADKPLQPRPDRFYVGLIAVLIIVGGNFLRIVFELSAPALIIISFELVHYPLAFLLGMVGLIAIVYVGNQLVVFENSE